MIPFRSKLPNLPNLPSFLIQRGTFPWFRMLKDLCYQGMGLNDFTTMERTGEAWLIHTLLPKLVSTERPVCLDVGAHIGEFGKRFLQQFPDAEVHAFEPHPRIYSKLQTNLANTPAHLHHHAVGANNGSAVLYDLNWDGDYGGWQASLSEELVRTHTNDAVQANPVDVCTLDTVLARESISHVDVLKIDVEGFEMDVFKGAEEALRSNRIGLIQFEFSELNVERREFVCDFQRQLPEHKLYRLLRNGLLPLDGLLVQDREIFIFQNILAVPPAQTDVLRPYLAKWSLRQG